MWASLPRSCASVGSSLFHSTLCVRLRKGGGVLSSADDRTLNHPPYSSCMCLSDPGRWMDSGDKRWQTQVFFVRDYFRVLSCMLILHMHFPSPKNPPPKILLLFLPPLPPVNPSFWIVCECPSPFLWLPPPRRPPRCDTARSSSTRCSSQKLE